MNKSDFKKDMFEALNSYSFDLKFVNSWYQEIVNSLKLIKSKSDLSKATRVMQAQKRVNVDFPTWMIESLDREAVRLGVTRQSIIKVWLAERLEKSA